MKKRVNKVLLVGGVLVGTLLIGSAPSYAYEKQNSNRGVMESEGIHFQNENRGKGSGGAYKMRYREERQSQMRDFWGASREDMQAIREDSENIREVLEKQGKTPSEFLDFKEEQVKERLEDKIEKGILTEERAQSIFQLIGEKFKAMFR